MKQKKGAKKRPPVFNGACSHLFLLVGLTRCTRASTEPNTVLIVQ